MIFYPKVREVEDYIDLLDKDQIINLCKKYGKSEKEVKKWLK